MCACFWCEQRRGLEAEYLVALERAEREPVSSDQAAEHVARLGLTRRQLAAELGCSLGTAQRVATPGGTIPRRLERRVLELGVALNRAIKGEDEASRKADVGVGLEDGKQGMLAAMAGRATGSGRVGG